ncbi:MAG: hypothetical protein M1819_000117 [Sarea resinae]|nr:MAG: hypothetical protein M1819_000117 [Sarea resinae]
MASGYPGYGYVEGPRHLQPQRPPFHRPRMASEHAPGYYGAVPEEAYYMMPEPGYGGGGGLQRSRSTGHRPDVIINNNFPTDEIIRGRNLQVDEDDDWDRGQSPAYHHSHSRSRSRAVGRAHRSKERDPSPYYYADYEQKYEQQRLANEEAERTRKQLESYEMQLAKLHGIEKAQAEAAHEQHVKEQMFLEQAKEAERKRVEAEEIKAAEKRLKEQLALEQAKEAEKKREEAERQKAAEKRIKEQIALEQAKEAQKKKEAEEKEKEMKKKAVEEWKQKQKEEEEKKKEAKKKADKEYEERLRRDLASYGVPDQQISTIVNLPKDAAVVDMSKTTWIKVHRKHIMIETLQEYGLPWEWDAFDPNYILIKQWVPENEQMILFEHTRRIRETRRTIQMAEQQQQQQQQQHLQQRDDIIYVAKKAPAKKKKIPAKAGLFDLMWG